MKRYQFREPQDRRGAMLPLVALLIFILLGCLAFAIDVAYMQLINIELKTSVDAAARAAGESLSRQQNVNDARAAAHVLAGLNKVNNEPLLLDESDIIFGHSAVSQASGRWEFTPEGQPYNSVRVIGRRFDEAPSGSVPLFFGKLFGWEKYETANLSTVVRVDRDIILVIDRSSSMKKALDDPDPVVQVGSWIYNNPPASWARWMPLEESIQIFVDTLQETQQIELLGLVSYASNWNGAGIQNRETNIDSNLTENHTRINARVNAYTNIPFNGNTHISAGLDRGVGALLNPTFNRKYSVKTLILMTDGLPSDGDTPGAVVDAAWDAVDLGVKIYTLSFGVYSDQDLMEQVAQIGSGDHYHAETEEELKAAFRALALTVPLTFVD